MKYIWNTRFPTIVGILLLVIGVVVTSILVKQGVIFFGHAAPSDMPQNIRVTNISDTSFTLTYTTDAAVIGTLTIQGDKSQTVFDDRDEQDGIPKPYHIHSISAKNLSPNTSYTFKILSGTTSYLNGDKPFTITTPPAIDDNPNDQIPLAGKLTLPDGKTPKEALVFITTDNGQLLSTLLNASGLYIIPLNAMRTKDLSTFLKFTSDSIVQILATDGQNTSQVKVGIGSINPIPPIILSQNYDFTITTKPIASNSAESAFPVFSLNPDNAYKATPEIITPKENESFSDQQPQFNGTASPNSTITISIHSDAVIQTQIKTNASGNWTYRPTKPLSPGQHTLTITAPDAFGILHTVEQTFTVFAAGSQVNETATPSATLAPTKPPTPKPTSSIKPTATPTLAPSNTPIPTTTKSGLSVTPRPTLPPTGSNTVAVVSIAGVATTIIGIILFLLTSGATL